MSEGGEDPLYVARRLVRMAVEDIGLADPQALPLAMAAQQAVHFIGLPEGALALAECAVYLATAPKSNRLYKAYGQVIEDVQTTRTDPVPLHLRNAPTKLMSGLGYGKVLQSTPTTSKGLSFINRTCRDAIKDRKYYEPSERGYEKRLGERLQELRRKWEEQNSEE